MKKRIVVSFIAEDSEKITQELTDETKKLIGNTLTNIGFTHIAIFPGLESEMGQEFSVTFPPLILDISDYKTWE